MSEWLEAWDELYYFMRIFRDADTTLSLTQDNGTTFGDNYYGFNDPDNPIFEAYNIVRFQPEVNTQLPAIQIVIDDERHLPGSAEIFGEDIEGTLSLYLMCEKRQTLQYNGETYSIESTNTPFPNDNKNTDGGLDLLMLMRAYIFQRIQDFKGYTDSYISWDILDWTQSEYIEGVGGVNDMVALRLEFDIKFEKET